MQEPKKIIYYPGFCDRYTFRWARTHGVKGGILGAVVGLGLTHLMVQASTCILYGGVAKTVNYLFNTNIDTENFVAHGSAYACIGMALAIAANKGTNKYLIGKDMGLSHGHKIVLRNQAIAFALPLIAGLLLSPLTFKRHSTSDNRDDISNSRKTKAAPRKSNFHGSEP